MQLSELESLTASLCNDPSMTRYSKADIDLELDNTQGQWNAEVKIIKFTTTFIVVAAQRQYSVALLSGTILSFIRATFKGIDLKKRSKNYMDLYTNYDWTQAIGTPTDFFYEVASSRDLQIQQYLTLYPTPQANDAGSNLVVEYCAAHTPMSSASDVPFTLIDSLVGSVTNNMLRPYDFYIAYSAAARLLARDPTPENAVRMASFQKIGHTGKDLLIGVFKELEAEEPRRLTGGRQW